MGLVPGDIVVFARKLARPVSQEDRQDTTVRVGDGKIEFAILVEVAGNDIAGVERLGKTNGSAEGAVAIAQEHREILAAAEHQVRLAVAVEIPLREAVGLRGRVAYGRGEGAIPVPRQKRDIARAGDGEIEIVVAVEIERHGRK